MAERPVGDDLIRMKPLTAHRSRWAASCRDLRDGLPCSQLGRAKNHNHRREPRKALGGMLQSLEHETDLVATLTDSDILPA